MPPKRGGRPKGSGLKLTPEVQDAICKRIAAGSYPETAAKSSGISASTFYSWLAQGRKARRGVFRSFLEAIKKADADGEVARISKIQKIAEGGAVVNRKTVVREKVKDGQVVERNTTTTESYTAPQWQAFMAVEERRHALHWGRKESLELQELHRKLDILEKRSRAAGRSANPEA